MVKSKEDARKQRRESREIYKLQMISVRVAVDTGWQTQALGMFPLILAVHNRDSSTPVVTPLLRTVSIRGNIPTHASFLNASLWVKTAASSQSPTRQVEWIPVVM